MQLEGNSEKIKETISKHTGKSAAEVEELVGAKREKFSGLLTDAGAAYMIAKELGVKLEQRGEATKISALKEGMNGVEVVARVKQVFPKKEFEKNGKKGRLQNLIVADDTGEIRATLWNNDIDKFSALGAGRSDAIRLVNCTVKSFNEALQLSLNYNSSIMRAEENTLPLPQQKTIGLADLDAGMNDVSVKVRIKKIFPAKEFENERGKGKVMNFIIGEGLQEMRATAWNEQCDIVSELEEGTQVRIEGAYTKKNRGEVELQLGHNARVIAEKKE